MYTDNKRRTKKQLILRCLSFIITPIFTRSRVRVEDVCARIEIGTSEMSKH